jgi:DNA polymerase I-like protein with 3'-5' exonuclease and polymerase domains
MQTEQREIRMMWLMGLTIVAIAAWFLAVPLLSALCGIALIMSVMHYVDSIENPSMTLAQIKPILEDESVQKIGHHLKYDAHVLENHGIELKGWYFDTMLASYALNAVATRHGMDDVSRLYLSHRYRCKTENL